MPGSYEDLELADLVVLVGSNLAWCHPVLYQRIAAAKADAARDAGRADRSAPHHDRRHRRPASGDRPDGDVALFTGLLALSGRARRARPRLYRSAHRRLRGGAGRGRGARPCRRRRGDRPRPGPNLRAFFALFADTERSVTVYSQGVNQSAIGHRQGQRHHQLPSGDRPHRQARHGTVLGDRPAQRHGRARGRRPGQHACRAYGLREPRASRPGARFWNAPNIAASRA